MQGMIENYPCQDAVHCSFSKRLHSRCFLVGTRRKPGGNQGDEGIAALPRSCLRAVWDLHPFGGRRSGQRGVVAQLAASHGFPVDHVPPWMSHGCPIDGAGYLTFGNETAPNLLTNYPADDPWILASRALAAR